MLHRVAVVRQLFHRGQLFAHFAKHADGPLQEDEQLEHVRDDQTRRGRRIHGLILDDDDDRAVDHERGEDVDVEGEPAFELHHAVQVLVVLVDLFAIQVNEPGQN